MQEVDVFGEVIQGRFDLIRVAGKSKPCEQDSRSLARPASSPCGNSIKAQELIELEPV
jgi:hypothetical protein